MIIMKKTFNYLYKNVIQIQNITNDIYLTYKFILIERKIEFVFPKHLDHIFKLLIT